MDVVVAWHDGLGICRARFIFPDRVPECFLNGFTDETCISSAAVDTMMQRIGL